MRTINKCLALLALVVSSAANATIINNGDYTTVNGVDWLDLSITDGQSVNEALNANSGWTWATKSQYVSMFAEFETVGDNQFLNEEVAISSTRYTQGYTQYNLYADQQVGNYFSTLFGTTYTAKLIIVTYGWYSDNGAVLLGGLQENDTTAWVYDSNDPNYGSTYMNTGHENVGIFLVRDTPEVPEPTTLALMGLGLAGLSFSRRKNATQSIQQ